MAPAAPATPAKASASIAAAEHAVWMCGFRPFFLATTLGAPLLIGVWLLFLAFGLPLPTVAGGATVWHAHELIFGFSLAAVAGFALTAIPEFTHTSSFGRGPVRQLALAWLLGRVFFWSSGLLGTTTLALAALAHLVFLGLLGRLLAPRLWRDPERRHLSFLWALGALTVCVAGFYADALIGHNPARWLHASLGVLMMLIVVAMSRISMRIVNGAIDELGGEDAARSDYRARPPRRNLVIACIGLYTAIELVFPGSRLSGWLALAAAAAVCNLLSDWHIGRALWRRWPLMLYGVYVLMAAGYAVIGTTLIAPEMVSVTSSSGRHLLAIGALGLSIYVVMNIAGRMHCGHPLDEHPWVPFGACLIVVAALTRAGSSLSGSGQSLLAISGVLWIIAFSIVAWRLAPLWLRSRQDGGRGCEGLSSP
jgi:uncharacterized protein involved in response to NO